MDLTGKTLQNVNYHALGGHGTEGSALDVSALPQGFYFLRLLEGTQQSTVKFAKQ